jgi:tetratricopeptide (TPR) repeat protein
MIDQQLKEGIQLLREGDLDNAQLFFHKLLQGQEQDAPIHLWLGNCYVLMGELKAAHGQFLKVLEYNDPELKLEAKRQLRSLWFNRLLNWLILNPPLRVLLLGAVVGYALSFILHYTNLNKVSEFIGNMAIWGFLPLFFIWVFFIFTYFIGNIAFASGHPNKAARSARLAIILAGIFVIPANLLMNYAVGVKVLAIFLDIFLLCLLLSRTLNWLGNRLAGEETPLILYQITHTEDPTSSQQDTANV